MIAAAKPPFLSFCKNMYNNDFIDALTILSTYLQIENYGQNLSQSDKDDLMHRLDMQTKEILERIEKDLEEQNKMLKEILKRLE